MMAPTPPLTSANSSAPKRPSASQLHCFYLGVLC
jgi:hypothetical protein